MGTVNVYTAERMQAIEDSAITGATVDTDGNLTFVAHDGTQIPSGNIMGPEGPVGNAPAADQNTAGVAAIASPADVVAMTDNTKIVTPAGLASLQSTPKGVIPTVSVTAGSFVIDPDGTIHFTGASGIKIDNVFDGLGEDVYEIIYDMTSADSAAVKAFGFLINGAPQNDLSSYIGTSAILTYGTPATSAISALSATANSYIGFISTTATGSGHTGSGFVRLYRPGVNQWTRFSFMSDLFYTVAHSNNIGSGSINYTKIYTGFEIRGATNFTGTVKVMKIA